MRLDLSDLRLFLCVVEAGSITRGAEHAHLALASVSERLRRIEADAGVALLTRGARGVVPTEAGDAVAHHARRMLGQRARLQDELRDFASGARGTLRLYANTAAMTEWLPERLAPWLARHPEVDIDLKERPSVDIVRAVTAGRIDAGVVADSVPMAGLAAWPVAPDRLVVIVPVGHALASTGRVALAGVAGEPFVGLSAGSALQEHIDAQAARAGHGLAFRIRSRSFGGVCSMVSHGVGVGIVPESAAKRHRRRHPLRMLALTEPWALRQLCVCVRDWASLTPAMRGLLVHLGATGETPIPSHRSAVAG